MSRNGANNNLNENGEIIIDNFPISLGFAPFEISSISTAPIKNPSNKP